MDCRHPKADARKGPKYGILTSGTATHLPQRTANDPVNPAALFPNSLATVFFPPKGAQRRERMSVPKATDLLGISIPHGLPKEGTLASGQELSCSWALQRHVLGSCCRGPEPGPAALSLGALMGWDHVFLSHHLPLRRSGVLKNKQKLHQPNFYYPWPLLPFNKKITEIFSDHF